MREIKFRVWDVLNKRMLDWGRIFDLPAWEIFPGTPEQRPFNVMQYTGVHDDSEDQEELYDGDIAEVEYEEKKHICKVQYCGSGYMFVADSLPDGYLWMSQFIEFDREYCWAEGTTKLGNIHDNPELLGEVRE